MKVKIKNIDSLKFKQFKWLSRKLYVKLIVKGLGSMPSSLKKYFRKIDTDARNKTKLKQPLNAQLKNK